MPMTILLLSILSQNVVEKAVQEEQPATLSRSACDSLHHQTQPVQCSKCLKLSPVLSLYTGGIFPLCDIRQPCKMTLREERSSYL